jgi:putative ABC transport system ATP-binding protein
MTELVMEDLVVEFRSSGYPMRPLDGFSATVPDGSLAVLLGPSGCGKTTLLSCLAGILSPTSGSIRVGGHEITGLRGAALTEYRQRKVGIVFQSFNLVPSLTALQNVVAPLRSARIGRRAAEARASDLLSRVGLGDRLDYRPANLSGGQQQRVSLARALVHDPPLLIADEPTASLDYVQVEQVLRLLRGLAEPGRAVVVATHDDRLLPLADQVIEMVPAFLSDGAPVITTHLEPGEVLFRQGSRGSRIYVVTEGEVEIVRERDDGTHEVRAVLPAGEYFGEMGPLFGMARSATARARTAATVDGYTPDRFRDKIGVESLSELIARHPH